MPTKLPRINLTVDADVHARVKALAKAEGRSMSNYLLRLIEQNLSSVRETRPAWGRADSQSVISHDKRRTIRTRSEASGLTEPG